jgi:16S rRNA (cytosine967-C5)-methyltransferase
LPATPRGGPARGPDARAVALALLGKVLHERKALDGLLEAERDLAGLDPRDRAFARLLVLTSLRRLGQIDALIDHCLERPLPPRLAAVRDILRLGVAQLVFLGTPAHAAVDGTVRLAAGPRSASRRGLVNAVLRRLAREGAGLAAGQDAAALTVPAWLWRRWCATYGEACARAIAAQHLVEPPLDLSLKDPAQAARWAGRLDGEVLPTGTLRLPPGAGDVRRLPGFGEGAWWVQDAAAALVAPLLGPVEGRDVVELCAAPGGKTAQLAAAGARVTAVERSPARRARLEENLARLGLAAATVEADAARWRPGRRFERVLLDAPCTATGTLRRHPDVAHVRRPEDVAALAEAQRGLLRAAADLLAPGGILIYAVCSLEPEEGPDQIGHLLADTPELALDPVAPAEVGGLAELLTAAGELRTLPCHLAGRGGLDGFYAARLVRAG